MIVKELFAKLGLDLDLKGFAKATTALAVLKVGMETIADAAKQAATELANLVKDVANEAGEIQRTASRLGLSTTALQEMQAAARGAGVDAESLEAGLKFLERNAYEAAHGSSELAQKFHEIGINAKSFAQLKPDEQLRVLADKLQGVADPGRRASIAFHLMGRQGTMLLPVLEKGRAGIDELAESAHEFGTIMDEDLIKRSAEYRKVNRELAEAFEGLRLAIVGPLVGASELKKQLTEWIKVNRQFIAQAIHRVIRFFGDAIKGAIYVAKQLAAGIDTLITKTIGWKAAIAIIGAELALWGVVALGPWLALAAGIGAVLLVLEDIGVYLDGGDSVFGDMVKKFPTIWDPVTNALKTATKIWKETLQAFFDWVTGQNTLKRGASGMTPMQEDIAAKGLNLLTAIPGMTKLLEWRFGKAGVDLARQRAASGTYVAPVEYGSAMFSGAAGTEGNTINQTINALPGMDVKDLGDYSVKAMVDALDRQNAATLPQVAP